MRLGNWLRRLRGSAEPQAEALHRAAGDHHRAGRLADAEALYLALLRRQPGNAGLWNDLACTYFAQQRLSEAREAFARSLAANPQLARAHHNYAALHHQEGRLEEAVRHARRAVDLDPGCVDFLLQLGDLLGRQGERKDAIVAFRAALREAPDLPEARLRLAVALHVEGQADEAEAHYRAALAVQPGLAEAQLNLGLILEDRGDVAGAMAAYRNALAAHPELVEAHANLAMQLLLAGDFEHGWREYEWRLRYGALSRAAELPGSRRWNGERLQGETVLLEAEQGYGDVLQFVRYAPLVAQRGGTVVVVCAPPLMRLLAETPGVSSVSTADGPLPPFDLFCPLLSLPLVFQTRRESIPAQVPYLRPPRSARSRWADLVPDAEGRAKVGLVWASQSGQRTAPAKSLPLKALGPLAGVADVAFYSLQKGKAAAEAEDAPPGLRLTRLDRDLNDFADTAAAIERLDLVISVDTAVAHLAGALGRPVWVLLKTPPDWRWLLSGERSLWYPSATLFRQPSPGDWESVVAALARALGQWIEGPSRA